MITEKQFQYQIDRRLPVTTTDVDKIVGTFMKWNHNQDRSTVQRVADEFKEKLLTDNHIIDSPYTMLELRKRGSLKDALSRIDRLKPPTGD